MTDIFSRPERSAIMSQVRGRGNAATELRLAAQLRANHISGWRRHAEVFGNPDFVFYRLRIAVFVDGCFWHGCPRHGSIPRTNRTFWRSKLQRNQLRDLTVK